MKKAIAVSCTIFSLCLLLTSCGSSSNSEKADDSGHYGTSTSEVTTTEKMGSESSDTKKDETDKKGMGEDIGEDIGDAVDTAIRGAETIVSDIVSDIS